jgi:hypothetical protein
LAYLDPGKSGMVGRLVESLEVAGLMR